MSKRNLTFLIIILIVIVAILFGFFYLKKPASTPTDNGGSTNFFSNFNPFNKKTATPPNTTAPTDVSGYTPPSGGEIPITKLIKISSMPIAGYGVFMKERYKDVPPVVIPPDGTTPATNTSPAIPTPPATEFVPAIRYVDRATGVIYQTFADKIFERKFSSTMVPMVYEVYFGNKGGSVVMRYLKTDNKTIQTFVGALPKEYLGADSTGTDEIKGSFLPDNISNVNISPDTMRIFYLFNSADSAIGTTAGTLGDQKTQVFDSPYTEWLSGWPNSKIITLTTKPSANVPGYMYVVNPDKKDFNKVLGGINGLTTLASPDGKLVLYSDNTLSLNIYHTDTKNSETLGVKTLPEKCVWSSGSDTLYCAVPKTPILGLYPDQWYQGEISFSDEIWKINVTTGTTTMSIDLNGFSGGEDIDGTKLSLDDGENYLFFVNKKDSFLWKLDLK